MTAPRRFTEDEARELLRLAQWLDRASFRLGRQPSGPESDSAMRSWFEAWRSFRAYVFGPAEAPVADLAEARARRTEEETQ